MESKGEFRDTLQADAYTGYEEIYKGGRVREAVCMAHARRPFYDLYGAHKSAVAKEALERIAALYVIEDTIRGRSAEERRTLRNERSKSLLESMKKVGKSERFLIVPTWEVTRTRLTPDHR